MGTICQNSISNTLDHKWEQYCKQLYYSVSSIRDALTSGLGESNETIWETLEIVNLSEEIQSITNEVRNNPI